MWMFALPILGIAATGILATLAYRRLQSTWKQAYMLAAVGLAIATTGLSFTSYPLALTAAQKGAISGYHQFLNGNLVSSNTVTYECERDGDCRHDYQCDPYTVDDSYIDRDTGKKVKASHTEYHDCPQATYEYTYTLTDSIGIVHVIADHIFAQHPEAWESKFRLDEIDLRVPRGIPPQWQRGKASIDAGVPDPVTDDDTYDNYILASEGTILKETSDQIDTLQKARLLPAHTANLADPIHDFYRADKVTFAGMAPPANAAEWQNSLARFNAALGTLKQGDMHIVAINASALPAGIGPDQYLQAVKAYWLTGLDKRAIAKNSIILVLGIDNSGRTIQWARATTGMPVGNGAMLRALQFQLENVAFDPAKVIGTTKARIVPGSAHPTVSYTFGSGIVEQTVIKDFPFERACMECKDENEAGSNGFVYLSHELPLPWWGGLLAFVIQTALFTGMWIGGFALLLNLRNEFMPSALARSYTSDYRPARPRRRYKIRL